MSRRYPISTKNSISRDNIDIYSRYKDAVDCAEKRKAWLEDGSYKGVAKMAINNVVKTLLVQSPNMKTYDDLAAPYDALQDSKQHFKENEELVKLDAIHDARAANVELNLPESGLPETATNVRLLPIQEQKIINSVTA